MNKVKILHLAVDEKFIDQAINSFQTVSSTENTLCVISDEYPRLVKSRAIVISKSRASYGVLPFKSDSFDILVIHSLHPNLLRTARRLLDVKIKIWLGWGYDYYDLITRDADELLLSRTLALKVRDRRLRSKFTKVKSLVKRFIYPQKKSLIENIDLFAPVLPLEYNLVRNSGSFSKFPRLAMWNYGNLEDDLIRGFENERVSGTNILLGNSATPENNHLDSFDLLKGINLHGAQIVAPLSYGDTTYRDTISRDGVNLFGNNFIALTSFLSIDEYVKIICSCNRVIMNHVRQQALGNIVIMLYLGAKVFLREECPTFGYLKSLGIELFSIQDLERDSQTLHTPLTIEQQQVNKTAIKNRWSKQAAENRTRGLIAQALAVKNGS